MNQTHHVRTIAIVGGGTAGWMAAAAFSQHFKNMGVSITLVESSQIGTVGVGEATIPTLRRFYQKLGFSDLDVLKASAGTCKLGIEFRDWYQEGTAFIHPFGLFGLGTKEVPFHNYWLRAKQAGEVPPLEKFSLGVQLATHDKFTLPAAKPNNQLEIFDWALHFDAALFAKLMRQYAQEHGVQLIDKEITLVNLDENKSRIDSVQFDDNSTLAADLFIDCSGFTSLLLGQALGVGYQDWSEWLLCDSAVAVQSEIVGQPPSRTLATARDAGWQWTIPLQHRQGNGYVYCSRFIDSESAKQTLIDNIEGKLLHEPRRFNFVPGRRAKAWQGNCIAIGLSSGFLEPLESTSIALVETAIEKVLLTFRTKEFNDDDVQRFNEVTALEYERVRDFIILHYKANQRTGLPLWDFCRNMALPDMLRDKLDRYLSTGEVITYPWEIFGRDSWLAIFNGFKLYPQRYHARADNMPMDYLREHLSFMQKQVAGWVDNAPSHGEFLKTYCQYDG
ncbi:tryptophan 7-halogenase [Bowmanella sp. Y26]|uniref:tryptophan halogenase family protein n=1 Tax=Bowmanella yangjiangensis TaxID=2811230 RepID=UPI001BDC17D1|nr:tryptophan halogenase family protein [Bowmanella yangjiangensis]MBT1063684.1 tryptophan 7-halogenase [Bowmanella yangjiangensis]